MARLPNLTCKCGAFPMIDDTHEIRHGRGSGGHKLHTATACEPDELLPKAKPAEEPRRFRLGVTK